MKGKKIYAVGYQQFNDLMKEREIIDDNVEKWGNQAFIEVQGKEDIKNKECVFHFNSNHSNVLRLTFDDVEEDKEIIDLSGNSEGLWVYAITAAQAKELHTFIHSNIDKNFLIHCHAGISRSGAIAQYVCEVKDIPLTIFQEMNPYCIPNMDVLLKLRKLDK